MTVSNLSAAAEIERPRREERRKQPLRQCVTYSIEAYFEKLGGHPPTRLYELVLSEVEQPLLEAALSYTRGNVSKAAGILGINRATLRKKLRQYGID